jgi:hypothetical protein
LRYQLNISRNGGKKEVPLEIQQRFENKAVGTRLINLHFELIRIIFDGDNDVLIIGLLDSWTVMAPKVRCRFLGLELSCYALTTDPERDNLAPFNCLPLQ